MSNKKRALALLVLSGSLLTGMQEVNAFSSYARTITTYCSNNGYALLPEYEADTCDAACHNNASGVTAYDAGSYEYFCPAPLVEAPTCTDADGDGFYAEGDVCGTLPDFDDTNMAAYPGAVEDCTDGVDNDGNGLVDSADPNAVGCSVACTDLDGDGYAIEGGACGAVDCDDTDAATNPGAVEICSDAVDNNCNGLSDTADPNAVGCPLDCTDNDGDGYSIEGGSCGAVDCDDSNAEVNPGALELCGDGSDNNCNGLVDSLDGVCQSTDGAESACETPWWRSRDRRHQSHKKECNYNSPVDSGESHEDEDRDDDRSSHEDDRERDRDEERYSRLFRQSERVRD